MRIVFMGTPDFAVTILDTLEKEGHEIYLVVTQPDKPKGRNGALTPSPVKVWAEKRDLPVFQPERIRDKHAVDMLKDFPIDLGVVAAYGQIIPKEILDIPKYGFINVHASLLPKYRGASPIQWSIVNGDKMTGTTIMQMGPGLDDGDIIMQEEEKIDDHETGGSLFEKLATQGANLCCMAIIAIENGIAERIPQNEADATYVSVLKKESGLIDFSKDPQYIERMVRAFDPWPGTYTYLGKDMFKILKCSAVSDSEIAAMGSIEISQSLEAPEGCVTYVDNSQILIRAKGGCISATEVQLAGKKRMSVHDFLLGHTIRPGTMLGAS